MSRSRNVNFAENKFHIKKSKCANHKFFTGSIGEAESDDARSNGDALQQLECENVEDSEIAVEQDTRPQQARRPPKGLNVLTGDWWDLLDTASVAIVNTKEPSTLEEAFNGVNSKLWQRKVNSTPLNKTASGVWWIYLLVKTLMEANEFSSINEMLMEAKVQC